MRGTGLMFLLITAAAMAGGYYLLRDSDDIYGQPGKRLFLYCAAGIRPPVAKTIEDYGEEFGVRVEVQYGGSNSLLGQIKQAQLGDLYIAADHEYMQQASEHGLIDEVLPIAWQKPVLAVLAGNPKNIQGVDDLLREDVRVALGSLAAAIGLASKTALENLGVWEQVDAAKEVSFPNVPELANAVKLEAADVAIVWDSTVSLMEGLEMIPLPEGSYEKSQIEIAVLRSTESPTESLRFARYLTARDRGLLRFQEDFEPIQGDPWEIKPRILIYSGGVLRPAVQDTILEFKKREGVEVDTQFNGCGILVGSMKIGNWPDGYISCDVTFMDQVRGDFTDLFTLCSTPMVIITPKDNPHGIQTLEDLGEPGLKVGLCHEQKSALGHLTKVMLEGAGLYDKIRLNAVSDSATADLLVNELVVGAMDAAIVYQANVVRLQDEINVIPIVGVENAFATQPMGRYKNSKFPNLTARLLQRIKNSQERFIEGGFDWIGRPQ